MTEQPPLGSSAAEGLKWVDALPASLDRQARLLRALVAAAAGDPRWEALELGCSLAAGRADELSDLDVGLWHVPGDRPADADVDQLVESLGDVVEVSAQPWDGTPRWWVQYADGTQLDLVVGAADDRGGRAPGGVMLLDHDQGAGIDQDDVGRLHRVRGRLDGRVGDRCPHASGR
jgi:hypothetical protein